MCEKKQFFFPGIRKNIEVHVDRVSDLLPASLSTKGPGGMIALAFAEKGGMMEKLVNNHTLTSLIKVSNAMFDNPLTDIFTNISTKITETFGAINIFGNVLSFIFRHFQIILVIFFLLAMYYLFKGVYTFFFPWMSRRV